MDPIRQRRWWRYFGPLVQRKIRRLGGCSLRSVLSVT